MIRFFIDLGTALAIVCVLSGMIGFAVVVGVETIRRKDQS